jgi:protein-L-isoaspartate O-methyltransferase
MLDVIVVTGSMPVIAAAFLDRLAPGGRLFAVVGDAPGHGGDAGAAGRARARSRA